MGLKVESQEKASQTWTEGYSFYLVGVDIWERHNMQGVCLKISLAQETLDWNGLGKLEDGADEGRQTRGRLLEVARLGIQKWQKEETGIRNREKELSAMPRL